MHKDALVSFVIKKRHHSHHRIAIGSGFFVASNDQASVILVTAKHVIEDFESAGFGWITVGEKMMPIENIGKRILSADLDIAFWHIPSEHFLEYSIQGIVTLPLFESSLIEKKFSPTCSFALFGYPASKNSSLDMRVDGNRERRLIGLALHGYKYDATTKELCFSYSGKGTPELWAKHITNPPKLDGMSGSPCVRFVVDKSLRRLLVVVSGVFSRKNGAHEIRAVALTDAWHAIETSLAS